MAPGIVARGFGVAGLVLSTLTPAFAQSSSTTPLDLRGAFRAATFDEAPATASLQASPMRQAIMTALFQASLEWRDRYRKFNMEVLGEVGLQNLLGNNDISAVPRLGAQAAGAAPARQWNMSLVGGLTFVTGNGFSTVGLSAGPRFTRQSSQSFKYYVQGRVGFEHGGGATGFAIIPGGGVVWPMAGRPFDVVAGFDFPVVLFDGFNEKGPSFYGGIAVPIGGR